MIEPLSTSDQHLLVVDYKATDYGPIVSIGMLDATQIYPIDHHDEKNDNTIFAENKEHGNILALCSQLVLSNKAIDLIEEVGIHVHIKACSRRRQRQTYIVSNLSNEHWYGTLIVKKFHETIPTTRSSQYLLKQDGNTNHSSINTNVDNDEKVVSFPTVTCIPNDG